MRLPHTLPSSEPRGPLRRVRVVLRVEFLEDRSVPAVGTADLFTPTVSAGSLKASPADTPADRIDANVTSSAYGGVGSIQGQTPTGSFVSTGAVIGSRHILTAAHVLDVNNDGKMDRRDGLTGIYFNLNNDGDVTSKFAVAEVHIHPDFTGFNAPAVNDDLAILVLADDLPADVPVYSLGSAEPPAGTVFTVVGYGRSGDGLRGYTTPASATVKRVGENVMDAFIGQDDPGRPEVNEVFRFDFDGPVGNGPLGGPTLGNDRETTIGPGDSGAPVFDGGGSIVGVACFTQGASAPKFGSMGGGALLSPYLTFIQSILRSAAGLQDHHHRTPDGVATPLPPVTDPPLDLSVGGAGSRIGARPLRTRLSAVSFPPAQERPPVPPPLPPLPPADPLPDPEPPPPVAPPPEPPTDPVVTPPPPTETTPVPTLNASLDPSLRLVLGTGTFGEPTSGS